jgi:hypothetical protein
MTVKCIQRVQRYELREKEIKILNKTFSNNTTIFHDKNNIAILQILQISILKVHHQTRMNKQESSKIRWTVIPTQGHTQGVCCLEDRNLKLHSF